MTPVQQTLAGLAVFAFTATGAVISIQATKPATRATASATAAPPAAPSHSCADMHGKRFEWSWSNAPFASSCDVRPDAK